MLQKYLKIHVTQDVKDLYSENYRTRIKEIEGDANTHTHTHTHTQKERERERAILLKCSYYYPK
jgi:hypothetical protein